MAEAASTDSTPAGAATVPGGAVQALMRRHQDAFLIIGMLLVATCLYLLRSPAVVTGPTLWAEDGTVFFKDAIERGWSALLAPYAGQLLILSRTAALAASPFPVSIQPALYGVVAIAIAVLSCGLVLSSRWRDPVPLGVRFVCLLALLCAPGIAEAHGRLANAHWWLGIGLLLLGMLRDPAARWTKRGEIAFAAIGGLTGFVAIYGIPSLGVRALRNRTRHSWTILGVALAGGAVQLAYLVSSTRRGDLGLAASDMPGMVLVLAKRVMATAAIGDTTLAVSWPLRSPDAWSLVITLALTAALALTWIRGFRIEMAALIATLLGGWIIAIWAMTQPGLSMEMLFWPSGAARYFLVPVAVLYISLVVSWPSMGGRWRALSALLAVLLLTSISSDYRLSGRVTHDADDWSRFASCVDTTRRQCTTIVPPDWPLQVTGRGD